MARERKPQVGSVKLPKHQRAPSQFQTNWVPWNTSHQPSPVMFCSLSYRFQTARDWSFHLNQIWVKFISPLTVTWFFTSVMWRPFYRIYKSSAASLRSDSTLPGKRCGCRVKGVRRWRVCLSVCIRIEFVPRYLVFETKMEIIRGFSKIPWIYFGGSALSLALRTSF